MMPQRSRYLPTAMAPPSGYRWESSPAQPSFRPSATTAWDLRWWIIAAVATSIAVHAGLLIWMRNFRISDGSSAMTETRTGVFETEIEQISIPQSALQPLENRLPPDLSREVNQSPPVKDLPDISQIANELKDKAVILTPRIQDMAANVTLSTPAPGAPGDLIDPGDAASAIDVGLKDSLLNSSTLTPSPMKPADDQMVVDASVLGGGDMKDNVLKSMNKGAGGNNGLDGFRSLDDLVNYQGPITGDFKTMLRTDLLFDFGSASLRSEARLSLMKLGMIIQSNSAAQFRLIGHTDTIGDDASNQKLSEARAQAVKDWLVNSLKIDGSHIIVEGRGEREPVPGVDLKGDAATQQLNRRVEIHKTGGK